MKLEVGDIIKYRDTSYFDKYYFIVVGAYKRKGDDLYDCVFIGTIANGYGRARFGEFCGGLRGTELHRYDKVTE